VRDLGLAGQVVAVPVGHHGRAAQVILVDEHQLVILQIAPGRPLQLGYPQVPGKDVLDRLVESLPRVKGPGLTPYSSTSVAFIADSLGGARTALWADVNNPTLGPII
jgi:hypothetical protein